MLDSYIKESNFKKNFAGSKSYFNLFLALLYLATALSLIIEVVQIKIAY